MPPDVRILRPARTATQSGRRKTKLWRMEFLPRGRRSVEALMGWTASSDTSNQVKLTFPDLEGAKAFAKRHSLAFEIEEPRSARPLVRPYADNFRPDRRD